MKITLTETQISTLMNALRIASDQFVKDSRVATDEGQMRLAEQFIKQRNDTDTLCDFLESLE